jgi:hypothetical protein
VRYMLLIYQDEGHVWEEMDDDARRALTGEYLAIDDELREAGAFVYAEPLEQTASATTVRVRGSETLVTPGPVGETSEQLNGYYLIEADSERDALRWAARMPSARFGSIEVRPLYQIPADLSEEAA